ncbi:hypothetical protein BT96DRAFT_131417 [Gymnopus androsaceus JB14]|uniref:DUF6534 domain-containing protein n=1 Tax=Gymnopus androsaceus JB14 TaxID=1447944 RepID=A0A6A4I5X5_9AGAR|nr:hypothetical protein BT96DRAFT_131417 [Gymnopus androsaceus JB14]
MSSESDISSTIGAMFIGMIVGSALWGVSCIQAWYYFDSYRNDSPLQRYVVMAAWASDTIHQILITHVVYYYSISNFSDASNLNHVVWSVYVEVLMNAITGLLVQCFFANRNMAIPKKLHPYHLHRSLDHGRVCQLPYCIQGLAQQLDTYDKLHQLKDLSMSINVLAAVGDIAISVAICTMLSASKTGFAWSNHVINRLILFSINTGSLTSICAVGSLIFILALPNTFAYFAFYFIIGRFYVNSLLATLNARKRLLRGSSDRGPSNGDSHSLQDRSAVTGLRALGPTNNRGATTQIQVQIETIRDLDRESDNGETRSHSNSLVESRKTTFCLESHVLTTII